ncbi:hypothetical protein ACWCXH_35340 [Kitasatospora sp. NPDC001660]
MERELIHHHAAQPEADQAARAWMAACRWEDAMVPYAAFRGL